MGYVWMTDLLTGNLMNDSQITWRGKYGNNTYPELEAKIFKNNYTSFATPNHKTEEIFLVQHGFCKKLLETNSSDSIHIKTKENSMLLIVDPNLVSNLRIRVIDNSHIYFGPTDTKHFNFDNYELHYTVDDKSIHHGTTCWIYEKLNSSYGECIENKLKKIFIENYGCLPPWFLRKE